MEYLSTTSLSYELGIPVNELFYKLQSLGWIERKNDKWTLTSLGKQKGGQTRNNSKFGEFIVWPESISIDPGSKERPILLNATFIGKHYNISSQRLNLILSELGLLEKAIAGWNVTKLGKILGGKQFENETSGAAYVLWPESILTNKNLENALNQTKSIPEPSNTKSHLKTDSGFAYDNSFREKYPAQLRTKDGHWVRSRAEVIIDNALYDYNLTHAYERKLPIAEEVYSDFYIPSAKVYIEYWGLENDSKYLERKKIKQEIYKKYDFHLIELNDEDISNLDDNLPKKLLKFGIKVY